MSDGLGDAADREFAVVGVVSSAGGLRAMTSFFEAVPDSPGMAFVVVPHQHPGHASVLPDLLSRHTRLPVVAATDGMQLGSDRVHVAPPAAHISVDGGRLRLVERTASSPVGMPIDAFLATLARDLQHRAVAVILSGSGSDGTLGARAVRLEGGLVIAQDPATAEHDGMPRSAIAAGVVDWVLAPGAIPARLLDHARELRLAAAAAPQRVAASVMASIVDLLRLRTGRDFSAYKSSTLRRRVERRMTIGRLARAEEYLAVLSRDAEEVDRLFRDLLIGVTAFFRDPEVWQALTAGPLPELMTGLSARQPLRVWVPACSTGEEPYTIAILVSEVGERIGWVGPVQIFATDLDDRAIETARGGHYPSGIAADVGGGRLDRWFLAEADGYRVRKELRERVIFAQHDLLRDPPFTRIDLLSCRNLLIYLESDMQQRLVPRFHDALNPGGILVLGSSENVGDVRSGFEPIDARSRIFRRLDGAPHRRPLELPARAPGLRAESRAPARVERDRTLALAVERLLARRYQPPAILVDERGELLHVHGRTGRYLEPATGQPSHNAFAMAREGLALALQAAVREALERGRAVRYPGIEVQGDGDACQVTVSAEPFGAGGESRLVLVVFEAEPAPSPAVEGGEGATPGEPRVVELEREMQRSRDELRRTIEALQGSFEEQQSMNEELQSANEELEASKEEMQALNEELETVNAELRAKVDALGQVNDDMANLLDGTDIATVFLDAELRIRRFTRQARALIRLRDADVGRPLPELSSSLIADTLAEDAAEVLRTLVNKEREVVSRDGRSYLARVLPYRTTENVIDGLVVSFVDTTELVAARALAARRALASGIVDTVREPLLVLDDSLRAVSSNRAFRRHFGLRDDGNQAAPLDRLSDAFLAAPELQQRLRAVVDEDAGFDDLELELEVPGLGRRQFLLNGRRLVQGPGQPTLILLAMEPRSREIAGPPPAGGARAPDQSST